MHQKGKHDRPSWGGRSVPSPVLYLQTLMFFDYRTVLFFLHSNPIFDLFPSNANSAGRKKLNWDVEVVLCFWSSLALYLRMFMRFLFFTSDLRMFSLLRNYMIRLRIFTFYSNKVKRFVLQRLRKICVWLSARYLMILYCIKSTVVYPIPF
jgi:hypothetical protein